MQRTQIKKLKENLEQLNEIPVITTCNKVTTSDSTSTELISSPTVTITNIDPDYAKIATQVATQYTVRQNSLRQIHTRHHRDRVLFKKKRTEFDKNFEQAQLSQLKIQENQSYFAGIRQCLSDGRELARETGNQLRLLVGSSLSLYLLVQFNPLITDLGLRLISYLPHAGYQPLIAAAHATAESVAANSDRFVDPTSAQTLNTILTGLYSFASYVTYKTVNFLTRQ